MRAGGAVTDKVTYLSDVYTDRAHPKEAERRRVYTEGINIANQIDRLIEESVDHVTTGKAHA
jgi:hypothetical protein